ncbi:type II toxin-antitoxin system RelE/ParE family toxin [Escherichia coli]
MFTFIELQGFSKRRQLLLPDDEFGFQETPIHISTAGDIIAGTGSLEKLWNCSGMGKRGGIRIIYYNVTRNGRIYLALIYWKIIMINRRTKNKKALKLLLREAALINVEAPQIPPWSKCQRRH